MSKNVKKVSLVDLTCRTPPYDNHLVSGLKRAGVDVDLWISGCLGTISSKNEMRSVLDIASNTPGRRFRKAIKGLEYLVNGLGLHWDLQTKSPDIVHYQWLPLAESVPILEELNLDWARETGAGVVYTVHNVLPHDTGNKYRRTFERIYRIPDALICHTKKSKNRLVRNFDIASNKVWVIPHGPLSDGVISMSREKARTRLQIDFQRPLCLVFGFLRPYKGIEFLLDSWQHVEDQVPSARLVLAGEPEKGYGDILLSKIENLELNDKVDTNFEFLSKEELSRYIHASDILVYPYRDITQSGALLTGLTAGKPVVATNVGGFSEVIQHGETGALVEYGDEDQLAEVLVRLLQDAEKREELGDAGKEMVETEYSWDAIAQKTLRCYKEVVNEL